jgi:hypothetical protein
MYRLEQFGKTEHASVEKCSLKADKLKGFSCFETDYNRMFTEIQGTDVELS